MASLAAVPDLERELDALYALPLGEFTKARNDLAARLKRAHQAEAAEAVRALRKPTAVAGTANRLARARAADVRALLEAGERLRDAQQRALAGTARAHEVQDAATAEREAVRRLLAAAEQVGEPRPTVAFLDRLSRTLRAAAVDPAARTLLARGRLTSEVESVGFGPLEPVPPPRRTDEDERAERERLTALRAEARRLAKEARSAEQAAGEAAREATRLAADAAAAREAAERAATAVAEAEEARRRHA